MQTAEIRAMGPPLSAVVAHACVLLLYANGAQQSRFGQGLIFEAVRGRGVCNALLFGQPVIALQAIGPGIGHFYAHTIIPLAERLCYLYAPGGGPGYAAVDAIDRYLCDIPYVAQA
jgi:hypothetical protein